MWRSTAVRAFLCKQAAPGLYAPRNPEAHFRYQISAHLPRLSPFLHSKSSTEPDPVLAFFSSYSTTSGPHPVIQGFTDAYSVHDDVQLSNFVSSEAVEPFENLDEDIDGQICSDGFGSGNEVGSREEEVYEVDSLKLEHVLSLLQSRTDESLESSLDSLDINLHEEFVVRILGTPHVPGESLIAFFKWALKSPGFKLTARNVESLVMAISRGLRTKDAYAVWELVREIGSEKGNCIVNVETLNELIRLFSKLGKGKAGFEVFNKFAEFSCEPNEDTYYYTIEGLRRRSMFELAGSVSEKMLSAGRLPPAKKLGKIISWFCRGKRAKDAHMVYMAAKEKDTYPPRSSVDFLISSLCRNNETVQLALEMLHDFSKKEERTRAIKPFSAVIQGLCRAQDVDAAKTLLHKMIEGGPLPGNSVFNSVINALSKAGDMEEAKEMKKLMENRGLKPDVYTYTVIMSGYTKGGQMDDACEILSEAKKKHPKLAPATYHTLIRGYCKLEEYDKALKLLAEMEEFEVEPNVDEYNKLVQSLCLKALDWRAAEKLMGEMKEKGLHLNGSTQALVRAVREMEEEAAQTGEATLVT